jgi:hypothetical protein
LDDGKKLQEHYGIVEGSTLFLVAVKEAPVAAAAVMSAKVFDRIVKPRLDLEMVRMPASLVRTNMSDWIVYMLPNGSFDRKIQKSGDETQTNDKTRFCRGDYAMGSFSAHFLSFRRSYR